MVQCTNCIFIPFRFHVSGSCKDLQTYIHAISDARCVFDMAVSRYIYTHAIATVEDPFCSNHMNKPTTLFPKYIHVGNGTFGKGLNTPL